MVKRDLTPDRAAGRPYRPPAARACPSRVRESGLFAACGKDQRPCRPVVSKGVPPTVKAIADTGFIVAFGNRHDRHHEWAIQIAATVTPPLLTCEAVLAEAAFQLGSCSYVLALVKDGMLQLAFDLAKNLTRLAELAKQYEDRQPDLADLCVICMSELHPRHSVVTVDQTDFRVYRRNRREMIPIVCPPNNRG